MQSVLFRAKQLLLFDNNYQFCHAHKIKFYNHQSEAVNNLYNSKYSFIPASLQRLPPIVGIKKPNKVHSTNIATVIAMANPLTHQQLIN
jgi:hypothetical protein